MILYASWKVIKGHTRVLGPKIGPSKPTTFCKNIFASQELASEAVIRKFRITARDGKNYQTHSYNLDAIISVDEPNSGDDGQVSGS